MIKEYRINKIKYDFMGYTFNRYEELSFHHLIVPRRECKAQGLGDGYYFWNGAILNQETSHDYLHIIERIDRQAFLQITDIMIWENQQKEIDLKSLKDIRQILLLFEDTYKNEKNKSGQKILKRQFINNRIDLS